jgi:hypothetical protein
MLGQVHPGISADYAEYYNITRSSGGERHRVFDRDALEAKREELAHILITMARGVASGHFFARPGDDRCNYCDFKLICGSAREALFALKCKDPAVQNVLRLMGREYSHVVGEDSDE